MERSTSQTETMKKLQEDNLRVQTITNLRLHSQQALKNHQLSKLFLHRLHHERFWNWFDRARKINRGLKSTENIQNLKENKQNGN